MFSDFPLLYPVAGEHKARQKFREAVLPFALGPDRQVDSIITRLKKQDKSMDRIWNAAGGHQILLRMEESTNLGRMIYELSRVNGEHPAASPLLR
jgi:hypothetical protein